MTEQLQKMLRAAKSQATKYLLAIGLLTLGIYACQDDELKAKSDASLSPQSDGNVRERGATSRTISGVFTKDVGKPIPEEIAQAWIANYLKKNPDGIHSHYFGSDIFNELLKQEGAVGISLQYAYNESGVQQILLIAIDQYGKELKGLGLTGYADASSPCPPCIISNE